MLDTIEDDGLFLRVDDAAEGERGMVVCEVNDPDKGLSQIAPRDEGEQSAPLWVASPGMRRKGVAEMFLRHFVPHPTITVAVVVAN